jgi:hypothetical protein
MLPAVPSFRATSFHPVPRHNAQSSLAMIFLWSAAERLSGALRAKGCRFAAFARRPDGQLLTVAIADAARPGHHTFPRSTPQSFLPAEICAQNKNAPITRSVHRFGGTEN